MLFELALQLVERVPVSRNKHEHGELRAKRGHAAFLDVAVAGHDDFRDVLDDPGAIRSNR